MIFAVIVVCGCTKKAKPEPTPGEILSSVIKGEIPEGEEIYNYVLVTNSQVESFTGEEPVNKISVMGAFNNDEGKSVSAGEMQVNNRKIDLNDMKSYQLKYADDLLEEGKALIGHDAEISFSGSPEYTARRRTVYVPANIISYTNYLPTAVISQSQDRSLKWTPDPNNLNGKMYIQVSWYGVYSRFDDPTLPKSIDPLVYETEDDGAFTIPAANLQRFPLNGYVNITMARGIEYVDPSTMSRRRVYYFTISNYQTRLLKVVK